MTFNLLIKNGTIVSSEGERLLDIAIHNGKVAALLTPGQDIAAEEITDAKGLHVFPGIVDGHCHMRDPGRMEREDFWTGTQAAAAGGITTVCEMPISIPPVYTAEILKQRAETVQPRALIDFALYGTAGFENLDEIQGLADAGAVAFKTYLHPAEPGREKEFTGLICPDSGSQYETMEVVARTRMFILKIKTKIKEKLVFRHAISAFCTGEIVTVISPIGIRSGSERTKELSNWTSDTQSEPNRN